MKNTKTLILAVAALALLWPVRPCGAAGFKMDWVESEVVLDRVGGAMISYAVRWTAAGEPLHGFDFEGFQETPVFDAARAYALDAAGNRYPLEIRKVSEKKYDISLSGGRAFTDGAITYFFRYTADLEGAGLLTQTYAGEKRLAVFNWAPVQWQDPLAHQAVTVWLPVTTPDAKPGPDFFEKIGFRTEKFVNERFTIDHPSARNSSGENVVSARFFRRGLESRYHFQLQFYLDARYFTLKTMSYGGLLKGPPSVAQALPAREEYYFNRYFPGGMLAGVPISRGEALFLAMIMAAVFCALPFFIMTIKHKSMLTAQEGISGVNWDSAEWTPPKLQVGSFRKPGRVAPDLTPIEAGVLLDMPVGELLSLILANMERKGLLLISAVEPLRLAKKSGAAAGGDPYETVLLNSIRPDGTLEQGGVNETVRTIAAGLEQKLWDADLAATKAHYKKNLEDYRPGRADTDSDYYWGGYRRRFNGYINPVYARVSSVNKDLGAKIPELAGPFENFKTTQACYEGAFSRTVCHDACHSACHDACHSACHSACHGACHSACVSAGH